jgi:hypothetical protein
MLIISKSQINQEQGSKNIFVEKSAPVPEAKKLHAKYFSDRNKNFNTRANQ